jgi:hypothetical protein
MMGKVVPAARVYNCQLTTQAKVQKNQALENCQIPNSYRSLSGEWDPFNIHLEVSRHRLPNLAKRERGAAC